MSDDTLHTDVALSLFGLVDIAERLSTTQSPHTALEPYRLAVKELGSTAYRHRLRGLAQVTMLLDTGLQQAQQDNTLSAHDLTVLSEWPLYVFAELLESMPSAAAHSSWHLLEGLQTLAWYPQSPDYALGTLAALLALDKDRCTRSRPVLGGEAPAEQAPAEAAPPAPLAETPATPVLALDEPALVGEPQMSVTDAPDLHIDDLDDEAEEDLASPPDEPASVTEQELDMLSEALQALRDEFAQPLQGDLSAPARDELLAAYVQQLGNILNAASHLGLAGLQNVMHLLQVNLMSLPTQAEAQPWTPLPCAWIDLAQQYLRDPNNASTAWALARVTTDPGWPYPASADVLAEWAASLTQVQLVRHRHDNERAVTASADQMSLALPADIDPQVLNSLLRELPQHAQHLSRLIQHMTQGGSLDELDQARRTAHTLKGAGHTVGVKGVANLTHAMEDILLLLSKEQRLPPPALQEVLLAAADCLEEMSEALLAGSSEPANSLATYQQVLDWAHALEQEGPVPDLHADAPPSPAAPPERAPSVAPSPALPPQTDAAASETLAPQPLPPPVRADSPPPLTPEATGPQQPAPEAASPPAAEASDAADNHLRVPVALIDTMLAQVTEGSIIATQLQERLARLSEDLEARRGVNRLLRQLSGELEQLVDMRGLVMLGGGHGGLDALEMDQYNDLHMLSRRILESSADSHELAQSYERQLVDLRELMAAKERLQSDLQRNVQRVRMVEMASVIPRLQRTTRQAARMLGKNVHLQVEGGATWVDHELLNALLDPLMHVLRNAVDHGIEAPEIRRQRGKPPEGRIHLRFAMVGSALSVRCEDDGAGLDLPRIRAQALRQGLVDASTTMSDARWMQMVLRPGFSTRDEATVLSGRGIGMDVLQRTVNALRGQLQLHSQPGKGLRLELSVPAQLSAAKVLISRSPRHLLALSERRIEELAPVNSSVLTEHEGELTYRWRDQSVPAHRLESLLGLPQQALRAPGIAEVALIVSDENRQPRALIAPEIQQSIQAVVKPVNAYLPGAVGVDGVVILGDGAVATVVDLPDLLQQYLNAGVSPVSALPADEPAPVPLCLVVDDSVSVRRAMEQLLHDSGYDVLGARDGLDALGVLQRRIPDVMLVDLEMPRMNGLDLTRAIRGRADTQQLPVIMITSRFTDKHHQLAQEAGVDAFLTKPYTEDKLLGLIEQFLAPASRRAQVGTHPVQ